MKKRKNPYASILIKSMILLFAIFLAVIFTRVFVHLILPYDTYSQGALLCLMGFMETVIFILCALYLYSSYVEIKENEKIQKTKAILLKRMWRVEEELNQSPSPILLNCLESMPLPKEKISCSARATIDGKIVCKIHIDSEVSLDTCEEFLKYFDI